MDAVEQFAENLRAERLRKGWTQERLADEAGLHFAAVSLLERAGREPKLTTIIRLARALDVSPSRLLRGID